MMNRKAVSLLSGGLDSLLATRIIVEQGIEVEALHFTSPFCNCTQGDRSCGLQAVRTARELDVKVTVRMKGAEYLEEVVRAPKHGYGKNMNPCIDCRIFMLKNARKFMDEVGAGFVITGEVLGQRPMSQRRDAMRIIEKESGLEGLILRPLSAKHLPATIPEQTGIVDRERLLALAGRSRKPQYSLADSYDLKEFSCPGGGCLLTDPLFARKVKDLLSFSRNITLKEMTLLRIGRHFRLTPDTKLILGRDEGENGRLESLWSPPYMLVRPDDFKGPVGLISGTADEHIITIAANIMAFYGKRERFPVSVYCGDGGNGVAVYVIRQIAVGIEELKI